MLASGVKSVESGFQCWSSEPGQGCREWPPLLENLVQDLSLVKSVYKLVSSTAGEPSS